MGSFQQWLKKPDPKRATWLCGPEVVLREHVMDHIRTELKPSDLDYEIFIAGVDKDRDIWAAANQYPMEPNANRLIVVRDAEKIKNWAPLEAWLETTRTLPTVYMVFVSNEEDLPYVWAEGKKTSQLKPHGALFRDKSAAGLVRCIAPSSEIPKDPKTKRPMKEVSDLTAYVQSLFPLDNDTADYVVKRLAGNLGQMRNLCLKLSVFGQAHVSKAAIDMLCAPEPADDFVMSVINLDKQSAFLALEKVGSSEYLGTLSLLSYWLDVTAQVASLLVQRKTVADMAQLPGLGRFQVQQVIGVAKNYDKRRVSECRTLLALCDGATRQGVTDSPMEVLVAMW